MRTSAPIGICSSAGLSTINEFRFEAAAVDLLRASCAELLALQEGLP